MELADLLEILLTSKLTITQEKKLRLTEILGTAIDAGVPTSCRIGTNQTIIRRVG